MDTKNGIFQQAKRFLSGTLLSRVTGIGRDVAMAFSFGAHPSVAAFMMALRFSHLLRRLFGEGALHTAFVPFYESERKESPASAVRFYQGLAALLFLLTLAIVILSEVIMGGFYLWGDLSQSNLEVLRLTMWLMPSFLFLTQTAVQMSFLQCMGSFFLPGFSPVFVNLFWTAGALLLYGKDASAAMVLLCIAVSLGFVAQWIFLLPLTYRETKRVLKAEAMPFSIRKFSKKIRLFIGYFGLGALGVGAAQVNSALDALFARSASLEGPAYLWYSIRIQQVPIAFFGIALAGALLPSLSRAFERSDIASFNDLLRKSLKQTIVFVIPATVVFILFGGIITALLYQRGDFQGESVIQTVRCLWGYTLGLPPMVFILVLAPACYARKEFKVPVRLAILALVINTALNAFFVFGLGMSSLSIALSTSISAYVNMFYLVRYVKKNVQGFHMKDFWMLGGKVFAASFVGAVCALFIGVVYLGDPTKSIFLSRLAYDPGFLSYLRCFIVEALIFSALYLGLLKCLREKETFSMIKFR